MEYLFLIPRLKTLDLQNSIIQQMSVSEQLESLSTQICCEEKEFPKNALKIIKSVKNARLTSFSFSSCTEYDEEILLTATNCQFFPKLQHFSYRSTALLSAAVDSVIYAISHLSHQKISSLELHIPNTCFPLIFLEMLSNLQLQNIHLEIRVVQLQDQRMILFDLSRAISLVIADEIPIHPFGKHKKVHLAILMVRQSSKHLQIQDY